MTKGSATAVTAHVVGLYTVQGHSRTLTVKLSPLGRNAFRWCFCSRQPLQYRHVTSMYITKNNILCTTFVVTNSMHLASTSLT